MRPLVVALGLLPGLPAIAAGTPNVLMIAADDLRTSLGCYGDPIAQTPHLDGLSARGLQFDRAYCQQALCNPSRASLLTGLRPDTIRVWDLTTHFRQTRPAVVTLPQRFRENGYTTVCIGKIFHNDQAMADPPSWSVDPIFATGGHWQEIAEVSRQWTGKALPRGKGPATQRLDVPDEAYWDAQIADQAIAALRRMKGKPFFLAIGFWKPHLPCGAPANYWQRYQREQFEWPLDSRSGGPSEATRSGRAAAALSGASSAPSIALHDSREFRGYRDIPDNGPIDKSIEQRVRHGYYACVSFVDAQIGKVLNELRRLGLEENTVVVFWSDHGFHLGEHGLWGKTSCYELDARVPLILAVPDQANRGAKTDALVELIDLYPTLVQLCGLPWSAELEGMDLSPLLDDPNQNVKVAALTQHPRPAYYEGQPAAMGYSLRTDRFRYTEWRDFVTGDVLDRELYDHTVDESELRNVIDVAEYAGDITVLAELMEERVRPVATQDPRGAENDVRAR